MPGVPRTETANANLTSANLTGADLTGRYLQRFKLKGADLTGADLADANLTGVCYSPNTRWPVGFEADEAPVCHDGQ